MNEGRRGFLKGILAAGVAPYVVTTAGVLMPVRKLWTPSTPLEDWQLNVLAVMQDGFNHILHPVRSVGGALSFMTTMPRTGVIEVIMVQGPGDHMFRVDANLEGRLVLKDSEVNITGLKFTNE